MHLRHLLGIAIAMQVSIGFGVGNTAFAQGKVHAVLMGDTLDAGIGAGATQNIGSFAKLIETIGSAIGSPTNVKQITGNDFNCDNLTAALSSLNTTSDDMVVFYYSGHGYREDGQQSRFPKLWCHGAPPVNPLLERIALDLRSPANFPRMVWAVADACNATGADISTLTSGLSPDKEAAYRKLFRQTKGTMIMSGADMHQFSWYFPNGGQFTKNLLDVMAQEIKRGSNASWASMTPKAMMPFETRYNSKTFIQQPIYASTLIEPQ